MLQLCNVGSEENATHQTDRQSGSALTRLRDIEGGGGGATAAAAAAAAAGGDDNADDNEYDDGAWDEAARRRAIGAVAAKD